MTAIGVAIIIALSKRPEVQAMSKPRQSDAVSRVRSGGRFTVVLAALLAAGTLAAPAVAQQRLRPGLYAGDYTCPQGLTALRLAVEVSGGRLVGVFDFGGNGDIPLGAYTVRITRNRYGTYRLTPLRWIRRPGDYRMVGARLRLRGNELAGTITDPDCRAITLRGPVPAAD